MAEREPFQEDYIDSLGQVERAMSGGFQNGERVIYGGFMYVITAVKSTGPANGSPQVRLDKLPGSPQSLQFWVDATEVIKRAS